ncbi:hypothetical protein GGF46_001429 [Coemansia sp. RSA 552]|nr:hypothetical protein GGF46_001429 [Coemansia sp. RSA 552]
MEQASKLARQAGNHESHQEWDKAAEAHEEAAAAYRAIDMFDFDPVATMTLSSLANRHARWAENCRRERDRPSGQGVEGASDSKAPVSRADILEKDGEWSRDRPALAADRQSERSEREFEDFWQYMQDWLANPAAFTRPSVTPGGRGAGSWNVEAPAAAHSIMESFYLVGLDPEQGTSMHPSTTATPKGASPLQRVDEADESQDAEISAARDGDTPEPNRTNQALVAENQRLLKLVQHLNERIRTLESAAQENSMLKSSIFNFREEFHRHANAATLPRIHESGPGTRHGQGTPATDPSANAQARQLGAELQALQLENAKQEMLVATLSILALGVWAGCVPSLAAEIPPSSTQHWYAQPVDHADGSSAKWQQQYLVNATFYKPGGPVFISTPGELPVSTKYVDKSHFTQLAQSMGGLLVTMEHRFFGLSNPLPDLTGASLQHLTIENALEDFASFVRAVKTRPSSVFRVPVKAGAKVVFYGGSYSGNVAAWMRSEYPDLVQGAWSSSAIAYGRLENYQFDQSFGKYLQTLGCAKQFNQAIEAVDKVLVSGTANEVVALQEKFGVPNLTPQDTAGLLSGLGIAFSLSPVSNTSNPIQSAVCSFFNSTSVAPLDAYTAVIRNAIAQMGMTQEALVQMGDTTYGISDYSLGQVNRVWYYMGCTWFGNWQVAAPASTGLRRYRSELVDLSYFQTNCPRKFGSKVPVPVDVPAYNKRWFDTLKGVSNIYFTSGSLDLWHESTVASAAGRYFPKASGTLRYTIDGATHVQDLSVDSPDDLASVIKARTVGNRLVAQWIS